MLLCWFMVNIWASFGSCGPLCSSCFEACWDISMSCSLGGLTPETDSLLTSWFPWTLWKEGCLWYLYFLLNENTRDFESLIWDFDYVESIFRTCSGNLNSFSRSWFARLWLEPWFSCLDLSMISLDRIELSMLTAFIASDIKEFSLILNQNWFVRKLDNIFQKFKNLPSGLTFCRYLIITYFLNS